MNKTVSGFLERNLPDFKENIVVDFEEGKQALSLQSGSHPDYGMAEPLEHSIKSLSQLKNAGCVFTRFHCQQDTTLFDWCDENGLLVQEEIPYWGSPKKATPLQLTIAKQHADAMVHYHSHHPSIICWGVGNELGGRQKETMQYVDKMYGYFKTAPVL